MSAGTLLGPNARPMVQLGGGMAWKTREIKGIYITFQWLDLRQHGFEDTVDHACVPCMCLVRPSSTNRAAYIIPQPMAFLFGDKKGNPTAHLFSSGMLAAQQIGFDLRDRQAYRAIIDIIIEGLPDLILMPSEPPEGHEAHSMRPIVGIEAAAKINGKTVHEELL
jgi:hypothetical protein